jgi:nicotinamidase/pyrazinamidase
MAVALLSKRACSRYASQHRDWPRHAKFADARHSSVSGDDTMTGILLDKADALIIVDVQNDFLPGGALAVDRGNEILPALNTYIGLFHRQGLPVYASRDWHPAAHCSFHAQGGIWPPHCIAGSDGAGFPQALALPDDALVVSKAVTAGEDAYSAFQGTSLAHDLRMEQIKRLFIGGLATDYCVLNTVQDALKEGFQVMLLSDAIKAVNVRQGDGDAAIQTMLQSGAVPIKVGMIDGVNSA